MYALSLHDALPISITSSQQGSVETGLTEWLSDGTPVDDDYLKDFITHYMEPMEIEERIAGLAEEFPELAEIVELPYETNGYRRHAQATIGETEDVAFVLTSEAWGHEGGNDISVNIDTPEEENADLGINVDGDEITITLGTDDAAQPNSTANDVIESLNDQAGDLVTATNYRDSNGDGVVQAEAGIELTVGLNTPEEFSNDQAMVK